MNKNFIIIAGIGIAAYLFLKQSGSNSKLQTLLNKFPQWATKLPQMSSAEIDVMYIALINYGGNTDALSPDVKLTFENIARKYNLW